MPLDRGNKKTLPWYQRRDNICDDFERALKEGLQPEHSDYLEQAPRAKQAELRSELIELAGDRFLMDWRKGTNPKLGYYFAGVAKDTLDKFFSDLVREGQLTPYQVDKILAGNAHDLIVDDRYEIRDVIGSGGMGEVFKVRNMVLGKTDYAMKMIREPKIADTETEKRFQREIGIAASLKHQNIVSTTDGGKHHDKLFFVMEYIEGYDLSHVLKKNGPLDVERAVNYTLQAARGLVKAHKNKIVHRDIKPSNLMLDTSNPEHPLVKILDLGLAVRLDESKSRQITQTGMFLGTVDYMSPEQGMSSGKVDVRSDIYSLGCTLFHFLAGTPPFSKKTSLEVLFAHVQDEFPSVQEKRPEVPLRLAKTVARMTAKSPGDRQQSMAEVIDELDHCLEAMNFVIQCPVKRENVELEVKQERCYECKKCQGTIRYEDGAADHVVALRYKCPDTNEFARIPGDESDEENLGGCPECEYWVLVRKWEGDLYVYHWVDFKPEGFFLGFRRRRMSFDCPKTGGKTSMPWKETTNEEGDYCPECRQEVVAHRDENGWGVYHQVKHVEYPAKSV